MTLCTFTRGHIHFHESRANVAVTAIADVAVNHGYKESSIFTIAYPHE